MLRITKHADYGIVLLTRMAREPDRQFNSGEIAYETHLPQPIVSKILKLLAREGLLSSHRGVKGGYSLNRATDEITVADIVTALDGPIAVTQCIDFAPGECSQEPVCPVRGNWQRINLVVQKALEGITLAEMTQPLTAGLVTLSGRSTSRNAELI